MNALLLAPPQENVPRNLFPEAVDEGRGFSPPLGLLYIAAYVRERSSHRVRVWDCPAEGLSHASLAGRLAGEAPTVVGIYANSFLLLDALRVAETVKRVLPGTHVCVGGPHPRVYPEETARLARFDTVVPGEGEGVFLGLLDALAAGDGPAVVPGVLYRENGAVRQTEASPPPGNLDDLPFPARDLIDHRRYAFPFIRSRHFTTLMTSRGCPFRCTFCCDRVTAYRRRSVESVVAEFEAIRRSGIRYVYLFDDTFNVDRGFARELARELLRRAVGVGWGFKGRVDAIDEDLVREIKAAGCDRMNLGVESANPSSLARMKKDIDLDQVRRAVALCKRHDIVTLLYFILGCPGEGPTETERTTRFALELDPDYAVFSAMIPFPGTELYRQGLASGLYPDDHWQTFAARPTPDFRPRLWTERFTAEELFEAVERAYRRFYLRPRYIRKRLMRIGSLSELWRLGVGGLALARSAVRKGLCGLLGRSV